MTPKKLSRLQQQISEVNILASMEEQPFNTPITSMPGTPQTSGRNMHEDRKLIDNLVDKETTEKAEIEKVDKIIDEEIEYINNTIKKQMTKRSSFPLEEQEKMAEDMIDDLVLSEQVNIKPSLKQSTIHSSQK